MENNLLLSKFWARIWALLIDSIILGIFGFILGSIFYNFFTSLGENAKLIGWIISLFYFSILNSKLYKGQTFGKKILNIKVVAINGDFIDLKKSFVRALILTTPFFINGLKIKGLSTFSPVSVIQGLVISTIGLGIIIFYIFNKATRQSLHDLAVKTYVVQDYKNDKITVMPKIKKLPFYITAGIFVVTLGISFYTYNSDLKLSKLIPVYEEINKQDHISRASVSINYLTNGDKSNIYTVNISVDRTPQNQSIKNPELLQAAKTFINSNAYESDNDILNMVVVSGFDIGIASKYQSFSFNKPISEWKKDLKK